MQSSAFKSHLQNRAVVLCKDVGAGYNMLNGDGHCIQSFQCIDEYIERERKRECTFSTINAITIPDAIYSAICDFKSKGAS